MIRLCVIGPDGRMGRAVLALARDRDDLAVTAAAVRPGSATAGAEVHPGVFATEDLHAALGAADVFIDFTTPRATEAVARAAAERGVAGVIGTTGLDHAGQAAVDALAARAPVLWAPNFSAGVHVLLALAERAARALGSDFDLEIVELHHRHKRDAPSGTALALADALAAGRAAAADHDGRVSPLLGRAGDVGPRPCDQLGIAAVRGGGVIGEHTAHFLGEHERIEITHRAASRSVFAAGALRAAAWLAGRPAGRYEMRDVLAL